MSYLSHQTPYRRPKPPMTGRLVGIGFVILLHVGLIYALLTGLARDIVKEVTKNIVVDVVEQKLPDEEKLPPPPPPPPDLNTPPPPPALPPPMIRIENPPPQQNPPTQVTTTAPIQKSEAFAPPAPPGPPAPPARSGGSVDRNSILKNRPEYPTQSIRLEEEGTVVLVVSCNEDGRVSDARVEKSSGHERLDNSAVSMAKRERWKCTPDKEGGTPAPGWLSVRIPIPFRLEDAR